MGPSRTIAIAGAGIGGLTAALALARRGLRVDLLEQAQDLKEAGAGLQLSPNAARVLIGLGLADALRPHVVAPTAVRIRDAADGRYIARLAVTGSKSRPDGAPYWVIHRADLQGALIAAARADPAITITLNAHVTDFTGDATGVAIAYMQAGRARETVGAGLVGADGLWSTVRARLWGDRSPHMVGRTAWRTLIDAADAPAEFREPVVQLWVGPAGHLVVYPVRRGCALNIVAITTDRFSGRSWSTASDRDELLSRFPAADWARSARALLAVSERWLKWGLYDRPPLPRWSKGAVTLLGDAAHPMVPFLAQGAAMAIEDAAVLADALDIDAPVAQAMQRYEGRRRSRTARVQEEARANGHIYHFGGPAAALRNVAMKFMLGSETLLSRYDWIYDWRPPSPVRAPT